MKTIIAEKPSVAREIARIVGATKREEGYFEGGGYAVTWAFGHLVQLAMPDGYGVRGFVRDNLPIIPDTFTLVPRQVRTEKGYKPDSGVVSQIKVIKRLFDASEQIIVATDAGREGELIFRYLYHYTGSTTPFVRLWISSLTDKAIREGLRNLEDGGKYDNLYLAAKARSESDWLVGIYAWSRTRKGGWAIAQSPILGTTITLQRLKKRGYVSLTELHLQLNPSLCEPPST